MPFADQNFEECAAEAIRRLDKMELNGFTDVWSNDDEWQLVVLYCAHEFGISRDEDVSEITQYVADCYDARLGEE